MIVCIAEKPSVAREIARILGANHPQNGFIEGNGYCVTWTLGHLCTLKEPNDYLPLWKRWSLGDLPLIPQRFGIKLIDNEDYKRQFEVIRQLVEKADEVINCGDAGQEGELIQQWVLTKALCKCPIHRLWVSSLTDEAIREGFTQLRTNEEMKSLYEAGLARAIGDWLLGINATRLYTMRFPQPGRVLSVGRVQTPTLALIVERGRQIEHFVPTTSFELQTTYKETLFRQTAESFSTKEEVEALIESIRSAPLTIKKVTKQQGKELPPRLFDLTSLQVEANKRFGMTAETTLQTIQSLYEKKLTTYPRVDTTYLSEDIYPKVPAILKGLRPYEHLVTPILSSGKPPKKSKKVFDNKKVTDHHAIIPTGVPLPSGLTLNENRIYDLIALRFIAAFYPDAKTATTTVLAEVEGIELKATGKEILDPGWRVVLSSQKGKEDATNQGNKEEEGEPQEGKESLLPAFVEGETGPHEPSIRERTTEPPKYYTEATLLRAMETAGKQVEDETLREALKQNGIGRPSTRASIIETLFKRNYIRREKSSLRATETGIQLIDTIQDPLLKSAELTGLWEYKLRQIESGEYSASDFLTELKQQVSDLVQSVRRYH
ncbi:DNA topoisomerase 3 [Porphyromonas endodontalis]|uniref:DNA topoisomerase n=1 Tax=Porphyromonas endodontalis (strain ATCC 35406 / DSM 24491 / JCM 8526 / CCUG 16442 / BCRC 14492 / NCTC 13058 / HG 370) TaxID=553175 RepID=C3JCC0_POREA|nr:DNA topoisomerase 3 [Porphyromonas endodontalis]EEN82167.1 DNA topoisomerase [Porphyromonas endodontalis ATCC 35406]UBH64341.1 DNA topoisomerase 3 [Porphyromonas endodontalis]SUB67369.1 DNA topoisomerase 3 [Porphyromonas endodontalis]